MPTLYSMVNETGNRNKILEMCKFRFWLMHWIDPCSIEHSYACNESNHVANRVGSNQITDHKIDPGSYLYHNLYQIMTQICSSLCWSEHN